MTLHSVFVGLLTIFTVKICFALPQDPIPGEVTDDSALVDVMASQRNAYYVEAGNLQVTKILPEDHQGLPHQKWVARTSTGDSIVVIYNLDMGPKVPLKVGDHFAVGGQFIWSQRGPLIHWTHDDPRKNRPDGYVYHNGLVYGDTDHEDPNSAQ